MMTTLTQTLQPSKSSLAEPLVCCVLVNWNGWQDTVDCLRSLESQEFQNLYVVVVDNASTNDSVARIREAFPEIEIIEAAQNLGFSAGCNLGIRKAFQMKADFVWLLNNDTIAPPNTLTRLVAASADGVGITGTVLYYMHNPTQVQAWGGGKVFRSMGYVTQFSKPASFGSNTFLTFASVLIRSEVFTQIGLLDEQYFMYFDDSDYCFRARNAGWKLAIAADTAVLHKEGGTVGREKSLLKERIVTTSGLYFLRRHTAVPPLTMTLFAFSRFLKRLLRGDLGGVRAVARGVSDWWHERPAVLEQGS